MKFISTDDTKQGYWYELNGQRKYATYDYTWRKAYGAWRELVANGWLGDDFRAPERGNVGKLEGWLDYMRVCSEIAGYYEATGEPLACLLDASLAPYEGKRITCKNAKGRRMTFWVMKTGAACPYYVRKAKPSAKLGKRIVDGGGFHDIQIIEHAPPARFTVTESELEGLIAKRLESRAKA